MSFRTAITAAAAIGMCSCVKHMPQPRTAIPLAAGPVLTSPNFVQTPFLCMIQSDRLACVAVIDTTMRRGQKETPFPRGSLLEWSQPKGNGKGRVWFGCSGTSSCEGDPTFSSSSVTVTPGEGMQFVKGNEDVTPDGSLSIVEVDVENDKFVKITDRWAGNMAPPVLRMGANIRIDCVDDGCTISHVPPPGK